MSIGTASFWILGSLTFFSSFHVFLLLAPYRVHICLFHLRKEHTSENCPLVTKGRPPQFWCVSLLWEKESNVHFSLNWLYPRTPLLLFSKGFRWIFSLKESKRRFLQGDVPLLHFRKRKTFFPFFFVLTPHHKRLSFQRAQRCSLRGWDLTYVSLEEICKVGSHSFKVEFSLAPN